MTLTDDLIEIREIAAESLDGLAITVTTDPREAAAAVARRRTALLILASPRIEWQTRRAYEATWTAWAITGTSVDPGDALPHLEAIIRRLAGSLTLTAADPETFEIGDYQLPGYSLTFTSETI